MAIRKGARRVRIYNTSLGVYLYDPANAPAIQKSDVELASPQDLAKLDGQRLLVCYELWEDNSLDVEVVVGRPLTQKELATGRWMKTQRARLDLPSGTLHVDSADTLRLGDHKPTDPGATLRVPAGEYVLTLYRIFPEQLRADGIEKYRGPQEVVILTPAAEAKPLESEQAYLPIVPEKPNLPWLKAYKISGARFEGLVEQADGDGTIVTNLDRDAAKALGLEFGAGLRLEAGKNVAVTAIYLDDRMNFDQYLDQLGDRRAREHPGLDGAWFWEHQYAGGYEVLIFGVPNNVRLKPGAPLTITRLEKAIEPYDEKAWFGAATVSGGEIAGTVVRLYWEAGWPYLVLSVDDAALAAIGARPGDKLILRVGEEERPLPLFEDLNKLWYASHRPNLPIELSIKYLEVRKRADAASRKKAAAIWAKVDKLRRAKGMEKIPVGAFLRPDRRRPEKKMLEVQPMIFPWGMIQAPYPAFDFSTEPGTPVRLRKAP